MAQVRDPVCGMLVEAERAPCPGTYRGQPFYFCHVTCQRKCEATHKPD